MLVLLGFTAFGIDMTHAYAVRAKLQNVADATALAGVSALYGTDDITLASVSPVVISRVQDYAERNSMSSGVASSSSGGAITVCSNDILIGALTDPYDPSEAINIAAARPNVVRVTVRRDKNCNGPIQTFFGGILGFSNISVTASATALADDRFSGYDLPPKGTPGALLPFTISKGYFDSQLQSFDDDWSFDPVSGSPQQIPDNNAEIWLYPERNSGKPLAEDDALPDDGNGTYGTLAINTDSMGTSTLGAQIEDGITEEDMYAEIGTYDLNFVDSSGTPITYQLPGNPGLSAGLSDSINTRVGEVVAFFLHTNVTDSGANTMFEIVELRYGRMMEVTLNGNPNEKRVVVQPISYNGPEIYTDPDAPSSDGLLGLVRLVR
jgi:hypothetical protein